MGEKLLEMLEREDGCLSLGRVLAVLVFVVWLVITLGTFLFRFSYAHYSELTYFNMFCIGSVICGKFVDLKQPITTTVNTTIKKVGI